MDQRQQSEVRALLNDKLSQHENKDAVCDQILYLLTVEGCTSKMCIKSICNTDEEAKGVIDELIKLVDHMVKDGGRVTGQFRGMGMSQQPSVSGMMPGYLTRQRQQQQLLAHQLADQQLAAQQWAAALSRC